MDSASPVALFVAGLFRDPSRWEAAREKLQCEFGPILHVSSAFPFDVTSYYEPEMGTGLSRVILAFDALIDPEKLVDAKWTCARIERELAVHSFPPCTNPSGEIGSRSTCESSGGSAGPGDLPLASDAQAAQPAGVSAESQISGELCKSPKGGARRTVNLDPGYVDCWKVVLASFKAAGHKVYLSRGVFADPVLWYERGMFRPMLRGFPDFATGRYDRDLLRIRSLYLERLRRREASSPPRDSSRGSS